jgi:hypothetical protein
METSAVSVFKDTVLCQPKIFARFERGAKWVVTGRLSTRKLDPEHPGIVYTT